MENDVNGQVGADDVQVPILESPSVPQSNAEMIVTLEAGGMFSLQAADQFINLTVAQQNLFTACFIKKMLQDKAIRKAQEEAAFKQNQLTKENLRKN